MSLVIPLNHRKYTHILMRWILAITHTYARTCIHTQSTVQQSRVENRTTSEFKDYLRPLQALSTWISLKARNWCFNSNQNKFYKSWRFGKVKWNQIKWWKKILKHIHFCSAICLEFLFACICYSSSSFRFKYQWLIRIHYTFYCWRMLFGMFYSIFVLKFWFNVMAK